MVPRPHSTEVGTFLSFCLCLPNMRSCRLLPQVTPGPLDGCWDGWRPEQNKEYPLFLLAFMKHTHTHTHTSVGVSFCWRGKWETSDSFTIYSLLITFPLFPCRVFFIMQHGQCLNYFLFLFFTLSNNKWGTIKWGDHADGPSLGFVSGKEIFQRRRHGTCP